MAHRSDFLDVRGVRTHLHARRPRRPLLVLHPEFAAESWAPYHDALAAHFHVARPGPSRASATASGRTWLDGDRRSGLPLRRPARRARHRARVDRRHLARRLDRGGAAPSRIPSASSAWCSPAPAGIKVDGVARYDFFANPIEETLRHLFHDPTRAAQLLPTEYGAEVIVRGYHELTTLARLSWNPYLYDPKLQQRLPRVRTPTLIIWGEDDAVLPPAHGEAFAALLPDATLKHAARSAATSCRFEQRRRSSPQLAIEFLTRVMQFFYFHLMPWPYLPRDFDRAYDSAWVTLPNRLYDPQARPRALQRVPRRARARRAPRLRRPVRQRAPSERLRHHAVAQPDGGGAGAAHVARQARHPRQRHRPARPSAARRRGDRHARRAVGRPRDLRLRARHRLRAPVARRQSDLLARALLRGARPDPARLDRARPLLLRGQALPRALRQHLAAPAAAAASADLAAVAGQPRDHPLRRPATATRSSACSRRTPTPSACSHEYKEAAERRGYTRRPSSSALRVPTYVAPNRRRARDARPSRTCCGCSAAA